MKKLVVISIMAAMLLSIVAVAAMADATNWVIQLKASNLSGTESGSTLTIGWRKAYTDGIDTGEVAPISDPPSTGRFAYIVSRLNANTISKIDYRHSYLGEAGYTQTWNLEAFYKGISPVDGIKIAVTEVATAKFDYTAGPLVFRWGAGVDQVKEFTAANPFAAFSFTLPGNTAMATPAGVTVIAGAVPEPSSMLALASGLAGMAGFAIRRRRA